MSIALERVGTEDVRLLRLLQLYIHEWSARVSVPIGRDALYAYPELGRCEAELFVDVEAGVPLGFALTYRDDRGVQHVKEMFVVAGARRAGIGRSAMLRMLEARPGAWTLTVRPENPEGLVFWRRTLAGVPGAAVEEREEPGHDGIVRTRFSFTTPSRSR